MTIPEISQKEGMSVPYVAKIMRVLRAGGLVTSERGQAGGYRLAQPPENIAVGQVLAVLGGRLFEVEFCDRHAGNEDTCTHSVDCSIRSLWRAVQTVVDQVLTRTTLSDLLCSEKDMDSYVSSLVVLPGGRGGDQDINRHFG
jgi:Rrf2 family protein